MKKKIYLKIKINDYVSSFVVDCVTKPTFLHNLRIKFFFGCYIFSCLYTLKYILSLQNPPSNNVVSPLVHPAGKNVSRYSVLNSESSLIHSVQPSECTKAGFVLGGVTMKMMDEVAGIVAFRHCKTNVVTASIGGFTFLRENIIYI